MNQVLCLSRCKHEEVCAWGDVVAVCMATPAPEVRGSMTLLMDAAMAEFVSNDDEFTKGSAVLDRGHFRYRRLWPHCP